jgi:hypothetical protein
MISTLGVSNLSLLFLPFFTNIFFWQTPKFTTNTIFPKYSISYTQLNSTKQNHPMSKVMMRQPLSLQVWQDDPNLPPSGIPVMANRPISFAMLSFTLENKTEQAITLKLKKLEIRPVGSQNKIMSLPAFDLTLKPLEIAPQQYKFSQLKGYGNIKQVEAIMIYEFQGQSYTFNSPPVKVN